VRKIARSVVKTHVIFNNNRGWYAPKAAGRFREIIAKQPVRAAALPGL
jgi:hypothetical protein